MYPTLLAVHNLLRWLVLAAMLIAVARSINGWISNRSFSRMDGMVRHWTATLAHIQLVIGVWLYLISPIVGPLFQDFSTAVHLREPRFFGMEHSLMMIVAITILSIGSAKSKRKAADRDQFKTMAIWFSIALVIVLVNIPWPFSPLVSRPYFRAF